MQNFTRDFGTVRNASQNRCRICWSPNAYGLVKTPCDCSGTIGFVHKVCLRRWMHTVRNFNTCEICLERYEFVVHGPSFRTLLITFVRRPLFKLFKFVLLFLLSYAAMNTVFVSSFQLTKFFLDLNFISEDTSSYVLVAIGLYSSVLYCFCCCFIMSKAVVSLQDFAFSISEWWKNFKEIGENSRAWTESQMLENIDDYNQPSEIRQPVPVPQISFSGVSIFSSDSSSIHTSTSNWSIWQRTSEESRRAVLRSRTE